MRKLIFAVVLATSATLAQADYLVKDDGTVIQIPEGGNACEYHKDYNPKGYDKHGKYPNIALGNAIKDLLNECTVKPTREECSKLVLSPNIPDPACSVYDTEAS